MFDMIIIPFVPKNIDIRLFWQSLCHLRAVSDLFVTRYQQQFWNSCISHSKFWTYLPVTQTETVIILFVPSNYTHVLLYILVFGSSAMTALTLELLFLASYFLIPIPMKISYVHKLLTSTGYHQLEYNNVIIIMNFKMRRRTCLQECG